MASPRVRSYIFGACANLELVEHHVPMLLQSSRIALATYRLLGFLDQVLHFLVLLLFESRFDWIQIGPSPSLITLTMRRGNHG